MRILVVGGGGREHASLDLAVIGSSLSQTKNLEDGTTPSEKQVLLGAMFQYRWKPGMDIQATYDQRGRYEELSDPKYTDTGGIFDIMAVTVIQTHLSFAA